ncbi:MAG: radical SAM protein [Candidatus Cloacimonadaceae bacterium]|jgi:MoaA/NifB/PqqE/SkfB family radical SAM enzyme|nr:radical SAM protein [Candidatus Cloacimonadota bacterium]MCB5258060.1 radical SAM protein [Candidatus Cloacimonadota bacterium]MDD5625237.1 radical SAM protein [Candidatus Cloacimonadota bacterium]MDY0111787.1 radical SAM protein [Candidatus Syntrophosphaera sp.]
MKGVRKIAVDQLVNYLATDPIKKMPKIVSLAKKLDPKHQYDFYIDGIYNALMDEDGNWHKFTIDLFKEVNTKTIRKVAECFMVNSTMVGGPRRDKIKAKYNCNVPWALLLDPTSACNLSCTGCWASEYGKQYNLPYDILDSLVKQGKKLGIYWYLFSGGEPLIRKDDIIKLCAKHQDCFFFAFTNGTLVDEKLCEDMERVGNFILAFSIEGDEEATDMRRGKGCYQKVISAMELMKKHKLLFGYSTCYHRYNTENVGSDEFIDDMIARGCRFAWNFTYIPIGKDAKLDFIATPEQRAYMYRRIQEIRATKPIFALDFWNDGEAANGCIAGGRSYLHINANGDAEPCAFIHYANVNIKDVSLLEALRSPLFMEYKKHQPFNENLLRPCPLLDNPEILMEMVHNSSAYSTQLEGPETVDELCAKTIPAAEKWAPVADKLWEERKQILASKNPFPDN